MSSPKGPYTLYQRSTLGTALIETLDDLINQQRIEPQVAIKVLANFDRCVADVLDKKPSGRMWFKGHLDTYRLCDEVWTLVLTDVTFKLEHGITLVSDKIKIVANKGSGAPDK